MNDFDTLGRMLQDEGFQPRLLRGGGADLVDDAWSLGLSNHPDHLGWEILVGIEEFPREGVALFLRKFDDEEGAWKIAEPPVSLDGIQNFSLIEVSGLSEKIRERLII